MFRMLVASFSMMLAFSTILPARTLIDDPGDPDQVEIGIDGMGPGESAAIPIIISCDSDVGHITIPIAYDNTVLQYDGADFYGTLLAWDDISVQMNASNILTILGWHDVGGDPNPALNTNGGRWVLIMLYFSALPGAPTGIYPLEITVDPNIGPMIFGDTLGLNGWMPLYQNGLVEISEEIGLTDTVFVGTDTVLAGQMAIVPVSLFNDEDLTAINIPVSFDPTALSFIGGQFYSYAMQFWNVTGNLDFIVDNQLGIVTISGTGAIIPLNTQGSKDVIAELQFSTNPSASPGAYPLDIATDPPLSVQTATSPPWTPPSENGFVYIENPPSCDLRFDYLWAYGLCNSPWIDRQYSSRISNVGTLPANNVVLTITIPVEFIYKSSSPPASETGGTMTWSVGTLNPGESFPVDWYLDIPPGLDSIWVVTVGDVSTSSYEPSIANNHHEFDEQVGFSYDPNDKTVTPIGVDIAGENFITADEILMYKIEFENEGGSPALDIEVVDQLDDNLDWSTFYWKEEFLSHPEPCTVLFNPGTGIVTLDCDSIMLQPDSEGYFMFTISADWEIDDATLLSNEASIFFDFNPAILAPEDGPLRRIVDVAIPVSNVGNLPDTIIQTSFAVSWNSNDGFGSGVAYHDIYVRVNDDPYTLWLDNVQDTSAEYTGVSGNKYSFYSVATDNVGHIENIPPPSNPDAEIYLKPPPSYTIGDVNATDSYNGLDITYGVAYFKGGDSPLCNNLCPPNDNFPVCGDVNGTCSYNGLDITYGIAYLKGGNALEACEDCPPGG